MKALKSAIDLNWDVCLALLLAWALAGWLGAQGTEVNTFPPPFPSPPPSALDSGPSAPDVGPPDAARFFGAPSSDAAPQPADSAEQGGEIAEGAPEGAGSPGTVPLSRNDQFARPVEEEITEEVVARTDLSEGGSILSQIFSSRENIERLMGNDPTFVYASEGRRDPMIIPWIRREFDMRRLMEEGSAAEREGRFADALKAYHRVVNEYAGSRAAGEAQAAIQRIESLAQRTVASADSGGLASPEVLLPHEVAQSLTGILFEESNPNCLIGDNIYSEGDTIPNFEVTILDIQQDAVTFLYRDRQFTVPVATN